MKGLRKYLSPFAPDQSGAAAVFCELGGLVIILDAGGCAGNICGFDEPRWFDSKSAIFSAGLRDMDAILGRDDRLVKKIGMACEKIKGEFIAVIGTPVPAVIGTDYNALKRMIEKKTNIPAIAVDTNGMELYDAGIRKAYLELFRTFMAQGSDPAVKAFGHLGILGATPLDAAGADGEQKIKEYYRRQGWKEVCTYGMGDGLSAVARASQAQKNIVIAPSGLAVARWMEQNYGIPYEIGYPVCTLPDWGNILENTLREKRQKILIVHQQVLADNMRRELTTQTDAEIHIASWFGLEPEIGQKGDIVLKEEDQWIELVKEEKYDVIIGDPLFQKALPDYQGVYCGLPHFAVSGKR